MAVEVTATGTTIEAGGLARVLFGPILAVGVATMRFPPMESASSHTPCRVLVTNAPITLVQNWQSGQAAAKSR